MTFVEAMARIQARADPPATPSYNDDDDMKAMLAEVDLLALIQSDTGETGRKSGDRYDFKSCPICGHRDCFSYFTKTNSWSCFGASNASRYVGGTALEYFKATRTDDDTEAVKWLREETGHPYQGKQSADDDASAKQDDSGLLLPEWTAIKSTEPPCRNPVLIDGVVRQGHVMLLAGKGKIGKSFSAIELCVSVATGRAEWFGLPLKSSGACLFIDPELDSKSLDNRFKVVCDAMGASTAQVDAKVAKWSLRGIAGANMNAIISDLQKRCEFGQFALVVIDSCSCFVEGDENKSIDVRAFAAKVLRIAEITGATVLLVHHFGKAKDGDRSASDRARGSSVWLDFPDAVLTLTEVLPPSDEPNDYLEAGEYACILESGGIREFPRMKPIRLIFGYPVHRVDVDGITAEWKPNSSQRDGGKESGKTRQAQAEARRLQNELRIADYFIANGIGAKGVSISEVAREVFGDSRPDKTKAIVEVSELFDLVKPSKNRCNVVAVNPPPTPPEQPPQLDV